MTWGLRLPWCTSISLLFCMVFLEQKLATFGSMCWKPLHGTIESDLQMWGFGWGHSLCAATKTNNGGSQVLVPAHPPASAPWWVILACSWKRLLIPLLKCDLRGRGMSYIWQLQISEEFWDNEMTEKCAFKDHFEILGAMLTYQYKEYREGSLGFFVSSLWGPMKPFCSSSFVLPPCPQ